MSQKLLTLYKEKANLKNHILDLFDDYKNGILSAEEDHDIEQYSRFKLTEKLSSILDSIS